MKEILYIIILSSSSLVVLFFLTKLMGNKQLSQLNVFDYINGITIGSIAAEMATSVDDGFEKPLVAMLVYGLFSVILSYVSQKSYKLRKFISGKPYLLIYGGVIYKENLKKAKLDLSELLVQCRVNGYFDISDIKVAILEENGKISFLTKEKYRPLTPDDVKIIPKEDNIMSNIIIDGKIMYRNLSAIGKNSKWLDNQLKAKGINDYNNVALAMCDKNDNFMVFKVSNKKNMKEEDMII